MIQIAYQPAYDPYHTAFRLLRLTAAQPRKSFKIEQLRILDFYLAFPSFVLSIEGMKLKVKRAGLNESPDMYVDLPSAIAIFRQMAPIQDAAIQTLCLQGIFDFEKETFLKSHIRLSDRGLPKPLVEPVTERNREENVLIDFLLNELYQIPLEGVKGLKHRTGLLEHRYDYV